ncbi:MAG: basic amino acid ABC transporter substrate-binding protein [Kiritimatiellae bacterium]|nr:basic amino acid ABC transporter substrate-binding protein [Kiritimatiellia bacterium]NLD88834.1 basic amino acid ABC transporter substrate-binding protein [Lentisphaerota bacterium]HOU21013.1 basic amino acid ABC transporter substrate-binding protein [Kiritimatiellia bacterium]HPC20336.1 basic amino acid ABC transporter substrate-binding protein [Kiritimatiellia bacterium]HQQ60366.1 basic amino acid ABC transporter substrate-binding protein [Kiritimatiellia bacterium]
MKQFRYGALIVLAMAVLLAACSRQDTTKYLVMGTNAEFPPFETRGGPGGAEVVGFDVDVAKAIAAKVGLPLKIEDMKFDSLLPALDAGQVDMVLAGMTITPDRAQNVDFSDPYYKATQVVLMRKGDPVPTSKEDLKGRTISVQFGTTGDGAAAEIAGSENVRQFTSMLDAVVALMNSQVDFAVLDEQPAINFQKKNPADLELVRLAFDDEYYGVAVKKGNTELLARINETLAEIAADGRYDRFVDYWMVQMIGSAELEAE